MIAVAVGPGMCNPLTVQLLTAAKSLQMLSAEYVWVLFETRDEYFENSLCDHYRLNDKVGLFAGANVLMVEDFFVKLRVIIQIDQNGVSKALLASYFDYSRTYYNLSDFTGPNIMVRIRLHMLTFQSTQLLTFDALQLTGWTFGRMLADNRTRSDLSNGTLFVDYVKDSKFTGTSGSVLMDANADSTNQLPINRCDPNGRVLPVITKDYDNVTGEVVSGELEIFSITDADHRRSPVLAAGHSAQGRARLRLHGSEVQQQPVLHRSRCAGLRRPGAARRVVLLAATVAAIFADLIVSAANPSSFNARGTSTAPWSASPRRVAPAGTRSWAVDAAGRTTPVGRSTRGRR